MDNDIKRNDSEDLIDKAKQDFSDALDSHLMLAVIDEYLGREFSDVKIFADSSKVYIQTLDENIEGKHENFVAAVWDKGFKDVHDVDSLIQHFTYWFDLNPFNPDLNKIRTCRAFMNKKELELAQAKVKKLKRTISTFMKVDDAEKVRAAKQELSEVELSIKELSKILPEHVKVPT